MNLKFRHLKLAFLVFLFLSGTALAADYIVDNAPNTDANGRYVESNVLRDGVPMYTKGDWELYRQTDLMSTFWNIDDMTTLMPEYMNMTLSNLPPNDGQWYDWSAAEFEFLPITVTLAPAQSIPTMSTWGALIMITLLSGIAIAIIRKSHFPDTGARA